MRTVIFGLFLTALVSTVAAQDGLIRVTVVNPDGAPLVDASLTIARIDDSDSHGRMPKPGLDATGGFIFSGLRAGRYRVAVNHQFYGPATERTISVKSSDEIKLDIELGRACTQISGTGDVKVTDSDMAEITRQSLSDARKRLLTDEKKPWVLSTKNLRTEWLRTSDLNDLQLLDQSSVQHRADTKGDFLYLSFSEVRVHGLCVAVSVDYGWAAGRRSVAAYVSGAGFTLEFQRKDGVWVSEKVVEWVA